MAKAAAVSKPQSSGAIVNLGAHQLPAELLEEARKDMGTGVSTDHADNLVPLIYVLQAMSPQVAKKNPAYIEGAEAGCIWLREAQEPVVDGDEGIVFQPCHFNKAVIEWIPREEGGGFVARHEAMPDDAVQVKDPKNPNRVHWRSKSGHQYVETREHVGYVIRQGKPPMPYVIPMAGTAHKISRKWMSLMNAKIDEGTNKVHSSYVYLYRLKTQFVQNNLGEWYLWSVEDAGPVQTREDMLRGRALAKAFATGQKQADTRGYADGTLDTGDGEESDEAP